MDATQGSRGNGNPGRAGEPMGEWTLTGIAYAQTALAQETLIEVCAAIRHNNEQTAMAKIASAVRQMQTVQSLLAH